MEYTINVMLNGKSKEFKVKSFLKEGDQIMKINNKWCIIRNNNCKK